MSTRRAPLILPLLALPALIGCGSQNGAPRPLEPAALAAVDPHPGIRRETLARAVDALFADDAAGETSALLLMRGGRIVAERYGESVAQDTRLVGWAMASSVTGAMIGLLVSDGRLRLDESAPVRIWQRSGDPRGEITLRQLLQMRSGLRHSEAHEPAWLSDERRMLFLDGRDDMAAYAEAQPLEAEPGRQFEYSSASTVILADLAARSLTESKDPAIRRTAIAEYLRTRLFEPIGMRSAFPEFDAAGTLVGSSMIHATARDWARFGEFLRNGGSVRGGQVVPRGWIEFMTTPSPRNPGYGAQLWLNRPQPSGKEVLFPGMAPQNAFASIGQLGQYIVVSPDQKLTLVRLGHTDEAGDAALRRHLAGILGLFPKR